MADGPYDFAVLGSTPLALLVAGLLATAHRKKVVLVSEAHSGFRLTRGFDLSVGPITRPETWALLKTTAPEVRKLLAGFGAKTALERVDPQMVSETAAGTEALMHVRHLLLAHGIPVERLTAQGAGTTYRVRDALFIRRALLASPAAKWLEKAGVKCLPADGTAVTLGRDGVTIARGAETFEAARAIAADDTAILDHTDPEEREKLLKVANVTTLLTEPMKALSAPLTLVVDRGLMLLQQKGVVQALAAGGADAVARVNARLGGNGRMRLAGQTGFGMLTPADGAPIVGEMKTLRASVIAGLGPVAAFLAPAIARSFAGASTPAEQAWFAAREVKDSPRPDVAEYAGSLTLGSAS